jgi:hypothetical protein
MVRLAVTEAVTPLPAQLAPQAWAAIGAAALAAAGLGVMLRRRARARYVARVQIVTAPGSTRVDRSGAVRSVQTADLTMPGSALEALWTPMHLERLARTYWRFLSRVTLGLIRVVYTPSKRFVVLLARPLVLLSFRAPEYQMDGRRGVVRWRIERGVLVSRRGRGDEGYLQIDVRRSPPNRDGRITARVEVAVVNFYPAIASRLPQWVYANTQSRIHVVVTHGFLRSLARLDLAESRVGRFAHDILPEGTGGVVPDPPVAPLPPAPPERAEPAPAARSEGDTEAAS